MHIISVRDQLTGGYAVRVVSFRGEPVSPDYSVVQVGNLAKLPAAFVASTLRVAPSDLARRFTRSSWLALRADGSVAQVAGTKTGVQAQLLAAYE